MRKINTFGELYNEFADGRLFVLSGSWFFKKNTKEFFAQVINGNSLKIWHKSGRKLQGPTNFTKDTSPGGGDLFLIDWVKKETHCSCDEYRVMLGYSLRCQKRSI